jgi:hypothetical protein
MTKTTALKTRISSPCFAKNVSPTPERFGELTNT